MKFAKEEMMSAGLSDAIKDLAEEKDMKLSEEVISQWLQKRKKEKSKKKKTSQWWKFIILKWKYEIQVWIKIYTKWFTSTLIRVYHYKNSYLIEKTVRSDWIGAMFSNLKTEIDLPFVHFIVARYKIAPTIPNINRNPKTLPTLKRLRKNNQL